MEHPGVFRVMEYHMTNGLERLTDSRVQTSIYDMIRLRRVRSRAELWKPFMIVVSIPSPFPF